jgi:stage V sporulation protein SpoVS
MVLAFGPPDELTYGALDWQDVDGNLYAAASFEAGPEFLGAAQSALVRPAWDVEPYTISMAAANRAQAALVLWSGEGDVPQAVPGALTAVVGEDGRAALAAMGLVRVVP